MKIGGMEMKKKHLRQLITFMLALLVIVTTIPFEKQESILAEEIGDDAVETIAVPQTSEIISFEQDGIYVVQFNTPYYVGPFKMEAGMQWQIHKDKGYACMIGYYTNVSSNDVDDYVLGDLNLYDSNGNTIVKLGCIFSPIKCGGKKVQFNASVTLLEEYKKVAGYDIVLKEQDEDKKEEIPINSNDPAEVAKTIAFSLDKYVENIQGENSTIVGPTLDVFGKQFSLFEFETSTSIEMNKFKTEVAYDTENKLVKVLIGISTDGQAGIDGTSDNRMCNASWSKEYNQFKNLYKQMTGLEAKKSNKNGSYWNQFERLKGRMNRLQCKLFVSADMQACGYMEWSYETGTLEFAEGGFLEQASLGVKAKGNVPNIPLCYWLVSVTADESGEFLFKKVGNIVTTNYLIEPSLEVEVGLGMGKSEGKYQTYLEGSLSGRLAATISNQDPMLKVVLNGALHARGYALGHSFLNETYPFDDWQLYPSVNDKGSGTTSVMMNDSAYLNEEMLSRAYLENTSMHAACVDENSQYIYEQNGVFPYCEPKVFSLSENRMLLLMLGDDGTKSNNNRTSLMYMIYDGNQWSDAQKISDDGTYFDNIIAKQENDNIYVTYRKADMVFDDNASMETIAQHMNLYEVTFDGTHFGDPSCISEMDNQVLESGQTVFVKNGVIAVAWIENSENDIFLNDGINSIYFSIFDGNEWSKKKKVIETQKVISEISIGSIGGVVNIIYNLWDDETKEVTTYKYQENENSEILVGHKHSCEYTIYDDKLYFLDDEMLYSYDGSEEKNEILGGISNYMLVGDSEKLYLVSNVSTSTGSELFVTQKTDERWEEFTQFTKQGGVIRSYDAIIGKDDVNVVYNRYDKNEDPEIVSLIIQQKDDISDISADYIYYDPYILKNEGNISLEIGVSNKGEKTITSEKVVVKTGSGEVILDKNVKETIEPQQQKVISVELPFTIDMKRISAYVSIDQEEITLDNNEVATDIIWTDLILKNAKINYVDNDKMSISGIIVNDSNEEIKDVSVRIYRSNLMGEEIGEATIDFIGANEEKNFEYICAVEKNDDENKLNAIMVQVSSQQQEINYVNNEARVVYNSEGIQLNSGKNNDENYLPDESGTDDGSGKNDESGKDNGNSGSNTDTPDNGNTEAGNSGSDTNSSGTSGTDNNDAGTGTGGAGNGGASAGGSGSGSGSGSGAAAGGGATQPSGLGSTGATGAASTADSSSATEASTTITTTKNKLTTKNTKVTLSKTSYIYDGKAKKPTVKVLNSKGKVLKSSNYTVKYSNNVKAGKATVTIKFKGKYTGTIKATYTIKPKTTAITGVTRNESKVALIWKKQATQTSGYQIQYATDKKFTKDKQFVTVSGVKKTSKTIKKVSEDKTYYFRIRTYKTVNGKKVYSAWSKIKSVK